MPTITRYPLAGTNAERVLLHVLDNPGVSTNAIITQLDMNPTVVRKCLANLVDHNKVVDQPDEQGHHRWVQKGRSL